MTRIDLVLEGHETKLSNPGWRDGEDVWLPLVEFAGLIDCQPKPLDDGRQSLCRGDEEEICVLIDTADVTDVEGVLFGRLQAFAEPLDLQWHLCDDDILQIGEVTSKAAFGIGDRPPQIRLPEDGSERVVSSDHVRGKPAVFYMWASW